VLVVSEDSRLGREAIQTSYVLKQILDADVRVFCYLADKERKLDTPVEKLMDSISRFADEQERAMAKARTFDGMRKKAEAGRATGGSVYGYVTVPVVAADGTSSRSVRQIVPEEAAVIVRIFELAASGKGLKRIANLLSREGVPSPEQVAQRKAKSADRQPRGKNPRAWAPTAIREM